LTLHQIRNDFTSLAAYRRREGAKNMSNYLEMGNFFTQSMGDENAGEQVDKALFYRDIAVVRDTSGLLKVLSVGVFN
jgi:hypothetical protein